MQQDLPPQTQEVESIPLHQWCQLELGSCHHTAVQPLDLMEIAHLYASCGVLGVKANKIHGWDAQNAQGEQVAHLWTYMFLFKEEPYIEAFKHFLLGTGNFFQLRRGAPIVRLAQSAGLLSFSTPIDAIYLACMYVLCMDLIECNELHNVGPPVLTNALLGISLLDYTAHLPILAGPDEAAPSR